LTPEKQIALADAQAYAATQAQRKALANASAATSAYNLAVAEANVAKGSNVSAGLITSSKNAAK
jgi:hypothetical protein